MDLRYTKDEQVSPATGENTNIIAAIAISGVAAGCLLMLVIIMVSHGYMRAELTHISVMYKCCSRYKKLKIQIYDITYSLNINTYYLIYIIYISS